MKNLRLALEANLAGILMSFLLVGPAHAQSSEASRSGSEILVSGLSTASAGSLSIGLGFATIPVVIMDELATDILDSTESCVTCTDPFPVADEIIVLDAGKDNEP